MKALFLCVFVLVLASAAEKAEPSPQIAAFYSGFIQGLQLNSTDAGPCSNALMAAGNDVNAFVSDLLHMIFGDEKAITYFLLDGKDVLGDFQASASLCNWQSLGSAAQAITTATGQATLVMSFSANLGVFLLDLKQLGVCGSQWNACGFAAGELLRMTLSWGIN